MLPRFSNTEIERKASGEFHPLVVLNGRLFGPQRRHVGGEGHVIVGAGWRLVREVRRQKGGPVVLDDHGVVLRHVDRRRELVVSWRGREANEEIFLRHWTVNNIVANFPNRAAFKLEITRTRTRITRIGLFEPVGGNKSNKMPTRSRRMQNKNHKQRNRKCVPHG